MILLAYLALGIAAGVIAGLFGIGGGLIIVPALVFAFEWQGVDPTIATHLAVGTSLASILFTSASSVRAHHERGAVRWELFRPMALGLIAGSVLGGLTAASLSGWTLRLLIGIFAILIGVQMALGLKPSPTRQVPGSTGLVGAGAGIGWVSSIFGIGGGSLSVPFLVWCNVNMQKAVATSAAGGLPIALFGALTYVGSGWSVDTLPGLSLGYLYLPALLGIALTSIPSARLGARLAHQWPAQKLKRAFSLLLFIVGIRFLWQSLPGIIS